MGQTEQLPQYKCHKVVRAAKIETVDREYHERHHTVGYAVLGLEGGLRRDVNADWLIKHQPHAGGYFVQYEDGYTSYSPAEAFESGYTRVEP